MATILNKERQTVFDLAIQYCGDIEAAFEIIGRNDISATEMLPAGTTLVIPEVINQRVVDYYKNNGISPATDSLDDEEPHILITSEGDAIVTNDYQDLIIENNNEL